MSLGHWCFVCTVTCSLVFGYHWVETCHCAEFRFFNWRSFKLKHLKTGWIHWTFFSSQAITDPDHCPLSSSTTRPLQSTMATVTAATAGRTEQHSAVTDRGLTDFPLGRFNQLVANTLRVPALAYESVSATELLAPTLAEFEVAEINDLLLVTQAVTAVRTHCETLKSTALSQEWLPSTAVPGSMTDGLYGIRYAIPSPDSPCNCFSLAALHSRRCQNWHALKNAETLFPNCKMPHSSYTLAEFNCYGNCGPETVEILTGLAFKGDVVTTGQTAQSMCFATSLSTAKKILDTGLIPVELFTNSQVNNWFCPRSALLRSLQIYWSGHTDTLDVQEPMTLIIYNPGLERYLTSSTVHKLKSNWIDTEGRIEAYTDFNRLYLDHCWTTGSLQLGVQLNTAESRTGFGIQLPFTVKELMEPLQLELNCNKIFGMHCRGLVGHCILTVNQLELMHEDVSTDCAWQNLFTDEPLPKKTRSRLATAHGETGLALPRSMWRSLDCLLDLRRWLWLSLVTHWDWVYPRDLWGNCFWTLLCWLMHWSLGSRFTEDAHLHTAPRLIDTVQLITDCVFHWLASIVDHCMHVQVCDTDSLNQCQGEVLRYMHCTHTTAHSNDTVKHTHCLAQAGLTWLKSQKGWLSLHWFDLNCSLLVVLEKDLGSFQFVCWLVVCLFVGWFWLVGWFAWNTSIHMYVYVYTHFSPTRVSYKGFSFFKEALHSRSWGNQVDKKWLDKCVQTSSGPVKLKIHIHNMNAENIEHMNKNHDANQFPYMRNQHVDKAKSMINILFF